MSHPEFLAVDSVYTTHRCFVQLRGCTALRSTDFVALCSHCEAQFEVYVRSIQLGTASSPKQSHVTEFVAKSEQKDCFVASSLRSSVNTHPCQILPKNAPRNDESKRTSEFALAQTQMFGMNHV